MGVATGQLELVLDSLRLGVDGCLGLIESIAQCAFARKGRQRNAHEVARCFDTDQNGVGC